VELTAGALDRIAQQIFTAAGSTPGEAATVARRLVEANLCGHDSHGVIRVHQYVTLIQEGRLVPNQHAELVREAGAVAVMDGRRGFGQIVAADAMEVAIARAREHGIALVTLRNASHVGRLADWVLMAAEAGQAAIVFCNGALHRPIVAPFGGAEARGSTNPIAIALPVEGGEPLMLDFATSAIAEGKVRVASHKGVEVPEDCLIDADGQATRDPNVLYGEPQGALLPFGGMVAGHKGGGLWLMCDLLAGGLSGGRCAGSYDPERPDFANNMIAIAIAPSLFAEPGMAAEIRHATDYVKSSRPRSADGRVLLPGEPERRSRARRLAEGIPVPETTFAQLMEAGELVGLRRAELEAIARDGGT
jgi:hydroxycarboxylate dehydrogenase B